MAAVAAATIGMMGTSCTEDPGTEFPVTQPSDNAAYEYLASYDVIKSYCSANVGASVDASAYNEGGIMATLINSNFDEVVASYHMKHGGVVKDDGTMDFSVVDAFVDNAMEAGLNVYGHTLCWHSGQNMTYLNTLLEDKWVETASTAIAPAPRMVQAAPSYTTNASFVASRVEAEWSENLIGNGDFEGDDLSSFFISDNSSGATGVIAEGGADGTGHAYHLNNPKAGENWHAQLGIQFPNTPMAAGETWKLTFDVKSVNGAVFNGNHIQGSENYDALSGKYYSDIATTTEWAAQEILIDVDADGVEGGIKIILSFGNYTDDIYVDNISLTKQSAGSGEGGDSGDSTQVVFEGDFPAENKGVTYDIYNDSASDTYSTIDDGGNNVLEVINTTAGNNWEPQLAVILPSGVSFQDGEVWQFKMKIKSLNSSTIGGVSFQVAAGGDALGGKYYSINTSAEWQEQTLDIDVTGEGLATAGKIVLGLGESVDTFYIDDLQFIKVSGSTGGGGDDGDDDTSDVTYEWEDELIVNGDFEETVDPLDTDNWLVQVNTQSSGANVGYTEGVDGGQAIFMNNDIACANVWDTQLIVLPNVGEFAATDIYKLEFDIKTDNGSTITGAHSQTLAYAPAYSSGDITTSSEWTHYTFIITNAAGGTNFAMQFGKTIDKFYFDNISFKKGRIVPTGGHFEPLTDEEKKANVTAAMQEWVTEMISHTKGKVKVWDVVNESIDDSDPTSLRTGVGKEDSANFYWQDYMGENYVRDVVKMAREAAGDEELILFINDYGLEFEHNNNAKCDGLIEWIAKWEADGETVIDGIGSQMHVSVSLDPGYQAKQEEAVVAMLTKLAATGKLIKISEIDMRIALGNNEYQKTAATTEEQHKLMSEYYKFIVSKYFEIIPKDQQYGITHWSPTDATDDEYAWCAGEPIGLWTTNYTRKHAYAGFVEGLKGN